MSSAWPTGGSSGWEDASWCRSGTNAFSFGQQLLSENSHTIQRCEAACHGEQLVPCYFREACGQGFSCSFLIVPAADSVLNAVNMRGANGWLVMVLGSNLLSQEIEHSCGD